MAIQTDLRILSINRDTFELSAVQKQTEESTLASIARCLLDINLNKEEQAEAIWPPPETRPQIMALILRLKESVIQATALTKESPGEWLHEDCSGWGARDDEAAARPRELVAIDVLEFLAALMSDTDTLRVKD